MAQYEVFDFLCLQRLTGNDSFFSSRQVRNALSKDNNYIKSVRCDCLKLFDFGFLDLDDGFPKKFRIKKNIALKQRARLLNSV